MGRKKHINLKNSKKNFEKVFINTNKNIYFFFACYFVLPSKNFQFKKNPVWNCNLDLFFDSFTECYIVGIVGILAWSFLFEAFLYACLETIVEVYRRQRRMWQWYLQYRCTGSRARAATASQIGIASHNHTIWFPCTMSRNYDPAVRSSYQRNPSDLADLAWRKKKLFSKTNKTCTPPPHSAKKIPKKK